MDLKKKSYQNFLRLSKKKGMSVYRISKESGVSRPTFTYWKQGKMMPKTETLIKIADTLDTTIETLVG